MGKEIPSMIWQRAVASVQVPPQRGVQVDGDIVAGTISPSPCPPFSFPVTTKESEKGGNSCTAKRGFFFGFAWSIFRSRLHDKLGPVQPPPPILLLLLLFAKDWG